MWCARRYTVFHHLIIHFASLSVLNTTAYTKSLLDTNISWKGSYKLYQYGLYFVYTPEHIKNAKQQIEAIMHTYKPQSNVVLLYEDVDQFGNHQHFALSHSQIFFILFSSVLQGSSIHKILNFAKKIVLPTQTKTSNINKTQVLY